MESTQHGWRLPVKPGPCRIQGCHIQKKKPVFLLLPCDSHMDVGSCRVSQGTLGTVWTCLLGWVPEPTKVQKCQICASAVGLAVGEIQEQLHRGCLQTTSKQVCNFMHHLPHKKKRMCLQKLPHVSYFNVCEILISFKLCLKLQKTHKALQLRFEGSFSNECANYPNLNYHHTGCLLL